MNAPLQPIRVLQVEDSPEDAALILLALQRDGYLPHARRVETEPAMREALLEDRWDIVIADYSLPQFSGLAALATLHAMDIDLPFILVSGNVGEEDAVRAMRAGANDYILKDNLARLAPAVKRELRDAGERRLHRQEEHDRRLGEERFAAIFNHSPIAILVTDPINGRVVDANEAAQILVGRSAREPIIGARALDLVWPADIQREEFLRGILQTRAPASIDLSFDVDARRVHVTATITPIVLGMRELFLVMLQDVTPRRTAEEARRLLEQQLIQAQKMEAIGTLAGGIAHDFNNILTGIIGNVQLADLDIAPDAPSRPYLKDALSGCARAKELVSQILTFSRQREQRRAPASLPPIIDEALRLLRASLPSDIRIETDIAPRCPPILCDPSQMHSIVMNLATNAAHAMRAAGGVLTITLQRARLPAPLQEQHPRLEPGRTLRLSVHDTGAGMDAATRSRLFEPFFTTKPAGEGTGMGLALVHGIVRAHEGAIEVESTPGAGTSFHLYFPSLENLPAAIEPAAAPPTPGDGQRVMLVDDELAIIHVAAKMLTWLGYRPTIFSSAIDALEALRRAPDAVDAVISDLTMPQLGGVEFARELLTLRPDMPVLITTGYMLSAEVEQARAVGVHHFLAKPFSFEELAAALKDLLAQRPETHTPTSA